MIWFIIVLLNNKIINSIDNDEYKKVVVIECDNCIYCLISLVFVKVGCNKWCINLLECLINIMILIYNCICNICLY